MKADRTTKKVLLSLFSKANFNVRHLSVAALIKKLTAYINSQKIAHTAEVTELHHEIDRLTNKLAAEQMSHKSTKMSLATTQGYLDKLTVEVNTINLQTSNLQEALQEAAEILHKERTTSKAKCTELNDASASLHHTLKEIIRTLQALRKHPRIADYASCLKAIEDALIDNVLLNTPSKK